MLCFIKKLFGKSKPSCCGQNCQLHLTDEDKAVMKNIDPKIVVGKIHAIASHPDEKVTKVRVTQTEVAPGVTEQILCGGVNIEEGAIIAVATVGAKLSEDFEIGERKIRGEMSRGMICARAELNLSLNGEEKAQIWILPNSLESKIGTPLKDLV